MGLFDFFKKPEVDEVGNPINKEDASGIRNQTNKGEVNKLSSSFNSVLTPAMNNFADNQDYKYQVVIYDVKDKLGEVVVTLTSKCGINFETVANAITKLPGVVKRCVSKEDAEAVLNALLDIGVDAEIQTIETRLYNILLKSVGANKLLVVKIIMTYLKNAKLIEAKSIVDSVPSTLKINLTEREANALINELQDAGAEFEIY